VRLCASLSFNTTHYRLFRSLVAFGPKQRAIGEAAKTQETSNFKNTIGSLKRLIGRTLNDTQVQDVEKKFINAKLIDVNGSVGTEVSTWFFFKKKKQKSSLIWL